MSRSDAIKVHDEDGLLQADQMTNPRCTKSRGAAELGAGIAHLTEETIGRLRRRELPAEEILPACGRWK